MDTHSKTAAEQFLAIAHQFRLGGLLTESPHPVTRSLSETAERSIPDALQLLFRVDDDVLDAYKRWMDSEFPRLMSAAVVDSLNSGGNIFFVGCGATGRLSIQLDAMWRGFWRKSNYRHACGFENRTLSVMAGGDYALIKSVEGFEDFQQFGAKQIADAGLTSNDVVFAITEGGETSFVIGAAWQAVRAGAKVYFVYNNPDEILRSCAERSREIIDDARVKKVNLTTGPMAIMGSTRMQATSIQLCVMTSVLEMVIASLLNDDALSVPRKFLLELEKIHSYMLSADFLAQLSKLVSLEQQTYASGYKTTYFADSLGIDVLTDTTERSPTFCTPAFRKFDDLGASESWSFLFTSQRDTEQAWMLLLNRPLNCLNWGNDEIISLVPSDIADRQCRIMEQIGRNEILRFKIGMDGMKYRPWNDGDAAIFVLSEDDLPMFDHYADVIRQSRRQGASVGLISIGSEQLGEQVRRRINTDMPCTDAVFVLMEDDFRLKGITHVAIKMILNALSTCVMVRLGRVTGNCMTAVVPGNLKLIDRCIRCIQMLTGVDYEVACYELFDAIEYIRPRMEGGIAYPAVVNLTAAKITCGCSLEEAESSIF